MRGAIVLLAALRLARGAYPCVDPSNKTCTDEGYDNPFGLNGEPKTFTGEEYTFCLPKKWRYNSTGLGEWLFSKISSRHLGHGFIFERNGWDSQDIVNELARILMVEWLAVEPCLLYTSPSPRD